MAKNTAANKRSLAKDRQKQQASQLRASVSNTIMAAFSDLSNIITNMTPEEQGPVFDTTKKVKEVAEYMYEVTRVRVLKYITEHGERKTEKGTLVAVVGGYALEAQPARTGVDSKKLEAMLRVKGLDPTVAMDAVVTYKVNNDKAVDAVARGVITEGELVACHYEASYRVMGPQKVGGDDAAEGE